MRLIDADALKREGWHMSRTVQIDKNTMEMQTRKPTDFPAIEPQRKSGKWIKASEHECISTSTYIFRCSECGETFVGAWSFCPHCGADMRWTE